jgi:hypothetical protein
LEKSREEDAKERERVSGKENGGRCVASFLHFALPGQSRIRWRSRRRMRRLRARLTCHSPFFPHPFSSTTSAVQSVAESSHASSCTFSLILTSVASSDLSFVRSSNTIFPRESWCVQERDQWAVFGQGASSTPLVTLPASSLQPKRRSRNFQTDPHSSQDDDLAYSRSLLSGSSREEALQAATDARKAQQAAFDEGVSEAREWGKTHNKFYDDPIQRGPGGF